MDIEAQNNWLRFSLSPIQDLEDQDLINEVNRESLSIPHTAIEPKRSADPGEIPKKPQYKKVKKVALNLESRKGAPLPALNAEELWRKKTSKSALKQSEPDQFSFFENQITIKDAKEQDHNDKLAEQALQTLA